jgi:predicted glycosyltransferase
MKDISPRLDGRLIDVAHAPAERRQSLIAAEKGALVMPDRERPAQPPDSARAGPGTQGRHRERLHPLAEQAALNRHRPNERRFLFYSHDGVGLGHVRRNLAIADALSEIEPDAAILIATSAEEVADLGVPARADVLKLPGLQKVANDDYASRRLPLSSSDVRAVRASLLAAAVDSFRPTVLIADKHPLGIGGELRDALDTLHAAGGRAALGLRDILDEPSAVVEDWAAHDLAAHIAECYDRVLVYGIPSVFNTIREYRLPPDVSRMARYCGYVVRSDGVDESLLDLPQTSARPLVLATAGGGADGFDVLSTFVTAAGGMPWEAVVVSGRQADRRERDALRRLAAKAGVAFRTFVPTLSGWFPRVDALVCMGGYNTIVEAVAAGVPTVCVPRVTPRTEQVIRASAFARLDLLRVLTPDRLDAGSLRDEVSAALGSPRAEIAARAHARLDLQGAQAAARHLLELGAVVAGSSERALAAR